MLRVDRDDRRAVFPCQRHHAGAAHHERLLVGQRQLLARSDGGHRGRQSGVSHQRVHHDLRVPRGGQLRHGLLAGIHLRVGAGERVAQRRIVPFVGYRHGVGVELPGLLGEPLPAAAGRQYAGFEPFGILPHDVERLFADRAGRTQNGKSLSHGLQNTI